MKYRINSFKTFLMSLLISVLSTNFAAAQEVEKHLLYGSSELNLGNYLGVTTDLNYIYNEKYTAKFGFIANFRTSPNQPRDYNAGIAGLVTYGIASARETIFSVNLMAGRLYNLNEQKSLRFNAAVGIGYSTIKTIENWQKANSASFTGNYTYDVRNKSTASLIINPKLEIPLGRVFGFTVSPTAVINSESNYYGIGLGTMIGRIRSKPNR